MLPSIGRPSAVVIEALDLAVALLEQSFSDSSPREMVDEFEAYWRDLPGVISVQGHVSPHGRTRRIWVQQKSKNNARPVVVADTLRDYESFYPSQPYCGEFQERGLFVPLGANSRLVPPHPRHRWTEREIREKVLPWVSPADRARLDPLLGPGRENEVVVFSLPTSKAGHVLFGVWLQESSGGHPLSAGRARKMTPLSIKRLDSAYLRPRGGGRQDLSGRRVVVVGCGSVGGYAAEQLVCSGIGRVDVVDPEDLEPENFYRHVLGGLGREQGEARNKARLLAADLQIKFPYIRANAHPVRFERLLQDSPGLISGSDLVLFATGNFGLESSFTMEMSEQNLAVPTVHCWVEPHSVGWHALLSRPGTPGCIRCLVSHPLTGELHANRYSFCDPLADTDMDLSGCGSRFTPFGNLAAVRCAAQAVELAVEALTGTAAPPLMRSERGKARDLHGAGHATTPRYDHQEAPMVVDSFAVPRCAVCGGIS